MNRILILFLVASSTIMAQSQADWIFNMSPANILESVKAKDLTYKNGILYSLNQLDVTVGPTTVSKTTLYATDMSGNQIWNVTYPQGAGSSVFPEKMVQDANGNTYIAGGKAVPGSVNEPLLIKIDSSGNLIWSTDTALSINGDLFDLAFVNDTVYAISGTGLIAVDQAGNEAWSQWWNVTGMHVDASTQIVLTGFQSTLVTVRRFTSAGTQNLSLDTWENPVDVTTDANNNIYLLFATPGYPYKIYQYDSTGLFQWGDSLLPIASISANNYARLEYSPSGRIVAYGCGDSMFVWNSAGARIMDASLNGLYAYPIDVNEWYSGTFIVSGTYNGFAGEDLSYFQINGGGQISNIHGWSSGFANPEYQVESILVPGGLVILEQYADTSKLIKLPWLTTFSNDLCVVSAVYDTLNAGFINVTVSNNGNDFYNYPTVQIVSPAGDTIGNPNADVQFFGQGPGSQVYTIEVLQGGITDFSNYTFLFHVLFSDSVVEIDFCNPLNIQSQMHAHQYGFIYPNPGNGQFRFALDHSLRKYYRFRVDDYCGNVVAEEATLNSDGSINLEFLPAGTYLIRLQSDQEIRTQKLILIK